MVSDLWLDSPIVQVALPWVSAVPGVLASPLAVSVALIRAFRQANRTLWKDPAGSHWQSA